MCSREKATRSRTVYGDVLDGEAEDDGPDHSQGELPAMTSSSSMSLSPSLKSSSMFSICVPDFLRWELHHAVNVCAMERERERERDRRHVFRKAKACGRESSRSVPTGALPLGVETGSDLQGA
ncbi:hypothetical protein EYF80_041804 [Liparis tanakae]|uniref:Uncharacterized protein n=1 Tax=Liparis tanakae TaxID=230148 RepID=A0A4Z2G3U2_9TELE|nr:hypothetical protein EYF80_041804 [Liparis tanakae]